jgi:hypothetical protein
LNDEIKSKLNFYIRAKKKNINQNDKDQIEKYNTINLNRMMKLKTDKTFIKEPMKKKKRTNLEQIIYVKLELIDENKNK